ADARPLDVVFELKREQNGITDLLTPTSIQRAHEAAKPPPLHRLHLIELRRRLLFESRLRTDENLCSNPTNRSRDRRHYDLRQVRQVGCARQNERRSPLVRRWQLYESNITPAQSLGHSPAPNQSSSSRVRGLLR